MIVIVLVVVVMQQLYIANGGNMDRAMWMALTTWME